MMKWVLMILNMVLGLLFFYMNQCYRDERKEVPRKGYLTRPFIGVGLFIHDRFHRYKPQKINEEIMELYGRGVYGQRRRWFDGEVITIAAMTFWISMMGIWLLLLTEQHQKEDRIPRGTFLEGQKQELRFYDIKTENGESTHAIVINVPELDPSEREMKELFRAIKDELPDIIKSDSPSLEEVRSPLVLPKQFKDTEVQLVWESEDKELLLNDGQIRFNNLKEEGEKVRLKVTMMYRSHTYETSYRIKIFNRVYNQKETAMLIQGELEKQLSKEAILAKGEEVVELPKTIDGMKAKLFWYENKKGTSPLSFGVFGIFAGCLIIYLKFKELKQGAKRRQDEIRRDFPSWVNKFVLLMNAGMTFSRAFEKIVQDYSSLREKGQPPRTLYEEMVITLNDIQKGVPEVKAYEAFGLRCKIPELLRFTCAVIQNIRKGGQILLLILQQQGREALLKRQEAAIKQGEMASTRLILPMGIMFIAILVIVITPAFISLRL